MADAAEISANTGGASRDAITHFVDAFAVLLDDRHRYRQDNRAQKGKYRWHHDPGARERGGRTSARSYALRDSHAGTASRLWGRDA